MEPSSVGHAEDPSSERWLQYYEDARVRRRARGPELRTRVQLRKYRNRQYAMLISGFVVVGILTSIFYFVLTRASGA
jgi:hypothetical protein